MSLDITFQKIISLSDIQNSTSIKSEILGDAIYLSKNNATVTANYQYIKSIENDDNIISSDDIIINGITIYNIQYDNCTEILNDIVLTFQTKFITDDEEQIIYSSNIDDIDIEKMFNDTTIKYGYKIFNEYISL